MDRSSIVNTVQAFFDAINASDFDALLDLLHEDVVHDINEADRQIGKPSFRVQLIQAKSAFDETLSDISIMIAENSARVAAEYTRRGTYTQTTNGLPPADGQAFSLQAGTFFEIEDGLITRVTNYFNKAELVRQLSEG